MSDFIFCYDSFVKGYLCEYIKEVNKKYRFYLTKKSYIKIIFKYISDLKYLVVNFNDSIKFMKFIVKKDIHCDLKYHGHYKCQSLKNYATYFKYIVQNKCLENIRVFFGRFIPVVKLQSGISRVIDESPKKLFGNIVIDIEIIKTIFKYGPLSETESIIEYMLQTTPNLTDEFANDIIAIYKRKIIKYLDTNNDDNTHINEKFHFPNFLIMAYKNDDVYLFNFINDDFFQIVDDLNNIDKTKLNKKQLRTLELFNYKYKLNNQSINSIILPNLIRNDYVKLVKYFCPKIFKELITGFGNFSLLNELILENILIYNNLEYMEIICECFEHTNPELVNKLLPSSRSVEMAQLLIDHGADYEAFYYSNTFILSNISVKKHVAKLVREIL
ncbi:hypothetical protein [Acanthamoeba castellanii mimivirus]|uniref:Uncharacterized protein L175 n=4 Tax=Mimivirus TaxID=315393 RepID=A0A0G2YAD5_MIMIV|nr:hypothetical protein MIMI_gp0195 [Acanthamoeba polyphaga mimivirus]AHJ39950.1 hypothetical protein [Samba virus]ALR83686.1 hypothetical protein [Niemeyer virus]AMZ02623.1 hypothetical protein [Mimivirus Bombay]BAV61263.1 hypothetical protein [Acanthamoeba castellanii mimivirus]ADO18030.1 hypothetical protein [Acanthamoeba polyphaga mimivirus]